MLQDETIIGADTAARLSKYHLGPSSGGRNSRGLPQYAFYILGRFLRTLAVYAAFHLLVSSGVSIVLFAFLSLSGSAAVLFILQKPWIGKSLPSNQWMLAVLNGGVVALALVLWSKGLKNCGPMRTIMAEYAGAAVAAISTMVFGRRGHRAAKLYGLIVMMVAFYLLSDGWAMASHFSPRDLSAEAAAEEKVNVSVPAMALALLAGLLAALARTVGRLGRSPARKRLHTVTLVASALFLLPFVIFQLSAGGEATGSNGAGFWRLHVGFIAFGIVIPFYADTMAEEKLRIGPASVKHLGTTAAAVSLVELVNGMDFSLLGYALISTLLGLGLFWSTSVERTRRPSEDDDDSSKERRRSSLLPTSLQAPLEHLMSDNKSSRIAIFLLINFAFMLVEFSYGFISNSLGLISDACHMLFDCAALVIGLYASYISRLPSTSKYAYGLGRFEVLSGYVNAVFLILVAALIVMESIERILDPPNISTEHLLAVSVGGLLVNIVGLLFFHEAHAHAHGGSCSHLHNSPKPSSKGSEHVTPLPPLTLSTPGDPVPSILGANPYIHSRGCDHGEHHEHHHNGDRCQGGGELHKHAQEEGEAGEYGHSGHDNRDSCHHGSGHCNHPEGTIGTPHSHVAPSCEGHQHGPAVRHDLTSGNPHMDHNMHGIFLHVLADTLGSVGVVASTLLIQYKGWLLTDPACSIFISMLIVSSVLPLLHNSGEIILQRIPRAAEKAVDLALGQVEALEGVKAQQKVHVWSFTPKQLVASVCVLVTPGVDKQRILQQARHLLLSAGITHLTVQVEDYEGGEQAGGNDMSLFYQH